MINSVIEKQLIEIGNVEAKDAKKLFDIDVGSGEDFCFWIKKGNSYIYDSGLSED